MAYARDHKARTRERILQAARLLFAQQGFEATSIGQVMGQCGLTHGGFYAHFASKAALYAAAMERDAAVPGGPARTGMDLFRHIVHAPTPCTREGWQFLAEDVGAPAPEVRQAYARAVERLAALLADTQEEEPHAPALAAMALGVMVAARSCDEQGLVRRMASACDAVGTYLQESVSEDAALAWAADAPRPGRLH